MTAEIENPEPSDAALASLRKQHTANLIAAYRRCCLLSHQLAEVLHKRYLDQGGNNCPDAELRTLVETEIDPDPPGLG